MEGIYTHKEDGHYIQIKKEEGVWFRYDVLDDGNIIKRSLGSVGRLSEQDMPDLVPSRDKIDIRQNPESRKLEIILL